MRATMILCITLATFGLTRTASAQAPAGQLELSGSSTMGDWKCREPTVQPATTPADVARPSAGESPSPGMTLRFPVQDIDCGDATMNSRLREALQADRHPTIKFSLPSTQLERAAQGGSAPVAVDGALTIAGRTEPVRTEVTVTPLPGAALRVQGRQSLRMSAFGVKPPHLMLGLLKVQDLVHVVFDFVLRRDGAVALPGQSSLR